MNVSDLPQPGAWLNGQKMSSIGQQLLAALRFGILWLWASGPTSARPPTPVLGQLFWDTTVGGTVVCTNPGAPKSGTPATWGNLVASVINSIQPKTITISSGQTTGTTAITAVNVNKAFVAFGGFTVSAASGDNDMPYVQLTSSILLTATRSSGGTNTTTVACTVVEYA